MNGATMTRQKKSANGIEVRISRSSIAKKTTTTRADQGGGDEEDRRERLAILIGADAGNLVGAQRRRASAPRRGAAAFGARRARLVALDLGARAFRNRLPQYGHLRDVGG